MRRANDAVVLDTTARDADAAFGDAMREVRKRIGLVERPDQTK